MEVSREDFRKVMFVPVLLALLSIIILGSAYLSSGTILTRDIDLKGGMQLTIEYGKTFDINGLESRLKSSLQTEDIRVRTTTSTTTGEQIGLIIEAGVSDDEQLEQEVSDYLGIEITDENRSITNFGSALAATFWRQAKKAIALACLFMSLIIVFTFRKPVLFATILANVALDMITAVAIMELLGIKLSLASIAALLMLLGYGVDSNILLCSRALKERGGTTIERVNEAFRTGITMTITTMVALAALYIFAQAPELKVISGVLLFGLAADMVYTWTMNVNVVLWVSGDE